MNLMCFEQFVYELLCNVELRDSFGFVYVRSFCLSVVLAVHRAVMLAVSRPLAVN